MSIYDVIVIGRGLIGSATARHLAESGDYVCLIGPGEPAGSHSLNAICQNGSAAPVHK